MQKINADHLKKCIETLEISLMHLNNAAEGSIEYEMFRNSLVKSFEITLEQSGKLLKKKITPYFSSKKAVDELTFKDIFRHANKFNLLDGHTILRWFEYRDNRNSTVHDYGIAFAEKTLKLAATLIQDAYEIKELIDDE